MSNAMAKITLAVLMSASLATVATPAQAKSDDDVVRRGSCTGTTDWKLKVGPDDGRLEVEGEVDGNRNGQRWRWRLVHNGSRSAIHVRTTRAPSGSFTVHRRLVNVSGTDVVTFRARNVRSGERCVGRVRI